MPTLSQLKTAIATFLQKETSDFVVGGTDLLLLGINQSKRWAQLNYDFEMCRTQGFLTVDLEDGADFADIVGDADDVLDVKKIEAAYVAYADGYRPIEFMGRASQVDNLRRQFVGLPYLPTDQTPLVGGTTVPKLVQRGEKVFLYPDSTTLFSPSTETTVAVDVIKFLPDYSTTGDPTAVTAGSDTHPATLTFVYVGTFNGYSFYLDSTTGPNITFALYHDSNTDKWEIRFSEGIEQTFDSYALNSTSQSPAGVYTANGSLLGTITVTGGGGTDSDFFLTNGFEFLMWKTIIDYNYLWQEFVARQEGSLAPPQGALDAAWRALRSWDAGLVGSNTQSLMLE